MSKTRIIIKRYWSENDFFIAQVLARQPFNRWITIGVASSNDKAKKIIEEFK
jgi:hypothetical protein